MTKKADIIGIAGLKSTLCWGFAICFYPFFCIMQPTMDDAPDPTVYKVFIVIGFILQTIILVRMRNRLVKLKNGTLKDMSVIGDFRFLEQTVRGVKSYYVEKKNDLGYWCLFGDNPHRNSQTFEATPNFPTIEEAKTFAEPRKQKIVC
jgi:hypothetical protein